MKSSEPNVDYLFSRTNLYRVPLYQRHYVWNKKNWEHLWTDIKDKSNLRLKKGKSAKTHFTGAIVIQPDAGKLEIIDGQQRLTTFQIILCAIRDICEVFDNDTTSIAKTAQDRILNDLTRFSRPSRSPEQEEKYKLLPRAGSDRQTFQCLVASEVSKAKKKDKGGFIYGAYVYFIDEIKKYVTQDHHKQEILLDTLVETILKDFVMVQITVDSDDDPEKIFQTINGTGRALNDFDLLRNDLFLRAGTGTKREDLYKQHWQQFDKYEFWRREKGKVADEFLRDFLKAKQGSDFNEQQKLFDQYQMYCKDLAETVNLIKYENPVEYEFEELSRCAEVYRDIHNSNSELRSRMKFYEKFTAEFRLAPQILKPFVLYITNELRMSSSECGLIFDFLESYVVRRILYTGRTAPAEKINGWLLDILDKKKSFNLFDLWYLLSKQSQSDEAIAHILEQLFPNFNTFPSKGSPNKIQRQKTKRRTRKLGQYMSERIEYSFSDLKVNEFYENFCEIWPSSETLLQSCLKDGLPIVYSGLSASVEIKPWLDTYKFVTYDGVRELLEYEVQQGNWVGIDADSTNEEKIELPIEEILFAVPSTAMSSLKHLLDPVQEDVKRQRLTPVSKAEVESHQVKYWSRLYNSTVNSYSKHWLLPDTDATAVTRAGHVLHGTLKSFTDRAIYMQINDQLITVYMHGLYELNTALKLHSKPHIFMTYNGMVELSKHETRDNKVIGSTGKEKVILENKEILFAFQASSMRALKPHLNVSNKGLPPLSKQDTLEFDNERVKLKANSIVEIVTRAGHVLRGTIKSSDKEAILIKINNKTVEVFWHGLHDLEVKRKAKNEKAVGKFEMLHSKPHIFMTYNGIRKLSKYETRDDKVIGSKGKEKIVLDNKEILFAFPATSMSALQDHLNNTRNDVKNQKLTSVPKHEPLKFKNIQLTKQSEVEIVTRAGHVLQGTVKNVDKEAIFVQIGQETVKVFWHGLHDLEVKIERQIDVRSSGGRSKMQWQSMIGSKNNQPIRFICDTGMIELSQIKSSRSNITGLDVDGTKTQIPTQDVLFAYSVKAKSNDTPLKIWTNMKILKSSLLSSHTQEWQIENSTINFKLIPNSNLKIATHSGHTLQGRMKCQDTDAIYVQIEEQQVIIFKHSLSAIHPITSGDLILEREPFKFITYEKSIQLSQIETTAYGLTGIDESGNRLPPLKKLEILFAYSVKAASDLEPIKIDAQVENLKLKPLHKVHKKLRRERSHLDSAIAEEMSVRILTIQGHVLEGTIEHFDEFEIRLRINGQRVIVYKHGIYEFSTEAEGQL